MRQMLRLSLASGGWLHYLALMNSPTIRYSGGFVGFLVRRMGSHRVMQVAGSLTFTTLLALVPCSPLR
jgi:uncharacterized BrkB/YihY/UPF0761 family membrane protein